MANQRNQHLNADAPMIYEIRIGGHLDHQWAAWFGDASITAQEGGQMMLTCQVVDQAALHGLLRKTRDLGMPLVSVNHIDLGRIEGADGNA